MTTTLTLDDVPNIHDPYALAELANASVEEDMGEETPNAEELAGRVAPAAEKAEPEKAEPEKAEPEKAEPEADPEGVLAKDGKNFLPFTVLENTRKAKAAAEARARELEAEIEKLKSGNATQGDVDEVEQKLAALGERAKAAREDYGDEMGSLFEELFQGLSSALKETATLRKDLSSRPTPEDADRAEQQRAVREAIDKSPVIAEWESRDDAGSEDSWFSRSVDVYRRAVAADPEFAALSVEERFAALPARVQAVYGKDPELKAKPAKGKTEKLPDPAERIPLSSSDIPGGAADDNDKFGPLEGMSGAKMTEYFRSMDSKAMDALLSRLG